MRIALISPYDITVPGGVNAHIAHLAQELRRTGHRVRIVAPGMPGPHTPPDTTLIGRSIPIPSGGSLARMTVSPWLGRTVGPLLEHGRFDIVHLHEPFVPALPIHFLRLSRTTTVGTFHAAHDGGDWRYALFRGLLTMGARRLHGAIAVSPAAAGLVNRYVGIKLEIIPNGVDAERFGRPLPPPPPMRDGRPCILFVGRFEPRKGLEVLLEAYARLKPQRPETRLVVVGAGKRRAMHEAWVQERGLPDVHFAGYVPDAQLPAYYQHAAVYCAPNTGNESFGIVLLEAMAAGAPLVASDIEGFRAVVRDGRDGLLVPPEDPAALAETLAQLLADPARARALAACGPGRAREFDWPHVAARVARFYEQAIRRREAQTR